MFSLAGMLILVLAFAMFPVSVLAAAPPQPTYGVADVDGDEGEWDLGEDFFADMYRAGNPEKDVLSKLYLRYDCATSTLYALVLPNDDNPLPIQILRLADDTFIKINNVKYVDGTYGDDGTPPDFQWIRPYDYDGTGAAEGWEASITLAPGSYQINVHTQVTDDGPQTSAVSERNIDLVIVCENGGNGGHNGDDHEVGGDIYPVNKAALLAPWIVLAVSMITGAALAVKRIRI